MKSKDEIIHELEQQVSDMAMEITKLKRDKQKLMEDLYDVFVNKHKYFKLSDIQSELTAQNRQSNSIPPDH